MKHCPPQFRRGLSLIEMLIVMSDIVILAAIVLPHATSLRRDAQDSKIQSNLRTLRAVVAQYDAERGEFPESIERQIFLWDDIPIHPWDPTHPDQIQLDRSNRSWRIHPRFKALGGVDGQAGPYWYNSLNGSVNSRILETGFNDEMVDTYNEINGTVIRSLEQEG